MPTVVKHHQGMKKARGWALVGAVVLNVVAMAAVAERPSPADRTSAVGAAPTLVWGVASDDAVNLLTNGGFEQGTNGWTVSSRAVATKPLSPNTPREGTNVLRIDIGPVTRD